MLLLFKQEVLDFLALMLAITGQILWSGHKSRLLLLLEIVVIRLVITFIAPSYSTVELY